MGPKSLPETLTIEAKPYAFTFAPRHTALLIIDMQRDFLLPTGFGEIQGGDLAAVTASIEPTKQLLDLCRSAGMHVFHTREGHVPDLSDCPSSKLVRQAACPENKQHGLVIGDKGKMGRLLVRGEYGHDFVDELQPVPGEVVIDKPGKGAFWNTKLMEKLQARGITHLIVSGVTTECCFATTIREGNDRGFECCGITEATAGYNPAFKISSLDMIHWSQGLFGFVSCLQPLTDALSPYLSSNEASDTVSTTPPQTPPLWDGNLDIPALASAYRSGLSPVTVVDSILKAIEAYKEVDPAVWIYQIPKETVLATAKELMVKFPDKRKLPPLYGVPFSVKDSIDISGIPTTTACPPLAYIPTKSAAVYERVIEQGALLFGKTNLDQLATGLTGCRSPYGIPRSVYNKDYISGGSSSGNAVSVGASLVSFSLATDTAGSGRVPAAFNGVVGYKPTRGTVSFQGVTPACLSLDCCSFVARNVEDARKVWEVCEGYDANDRYAKSTPQTLRHVDSIGPQAKGFNFGIPPPEALAVCAPVYRTMFNNAVQTLQSIGGNLVHVDWAPFENAGKLLYDGTFVSERLASLPDGWLESNRDHLHPVIRELFEEVVNRNSTAVQAYRDLQAKALYTRQAETIFSRGPSGIIALVVPTAPTHWRVSEVLGDPIAKNSALGQFTHCGNVLDLTGISVPAGTYAVNELARAPSYVDQTQPVTDADSGNESSEDEQQRLPFGVTFLGGCRTDAEVLEIARRFEKAAKAK
ncbi:MAG: hypothetical protein M1840_007834 [Geoglossum simile]|nr:MAG: hypothetical protein M1840_007834 [Geoglossum simile]